jgi:hypothetical protein
LKSDSAGNQFKVKWMVPLTLHGRVKMIIGHLPAGYISSTILYRWFESREVTSKSVLLAGMIGAIAPDLDMVYFYLVDHCQNCFGSS